MTSLYSAAVAYLDDTRTAREELYKWFHQNPELSMQEEGTVQRILAELDDAGVPGQRVGHGVVAVLTNGDGPTVAMRADFDALPVKEDSGVDYASTATQVSERTGTEVPVAHMCGHDFHTTWLISTVRFLATHRELWSGTFEAVFQPAEETAEGGKDLVAHGITDAMPTPDIMLGQHVMGVLPMGTVATNAGVSFSTASTIKVTLRGTGSHGSMPEKSVDPIVLAANVIMNLQTIVSREIKPQEMAVVTVGAIHGGAKSNIIPSEVVLDLNTRCYSAEVQEQLHGAIERIVRGLCTAARAQEPQFEYSDLFPLLVNDPDVTHRVTESFKELLGDDATGSYDPFAGSEDFPDVPNAFDVPYTFWIVGGFPDPATAPGNHSPQFVPQLDPTLDLGTRATVAALTPWLAKDNG
ncbi:amidohydrolase [Corynebacterium uterequi]|uniref:Amidohydrolase n=1 Tax=Corynebacterium uterequi TaxID=1072256 RepID=A0A0G3HH49_9CORY|nr:amidohydrolase [Corynebacterium uterequi]AKK10497.1 amidohydrolase [Corynebacterium uterequi]